VNEVICELLISAGWERDKEYGLEWTRCLGPEDETDKLEFSPFGQEFRIILHGKNTDLHRILAAITPTIQNTPKPMVTIANDNIITALVVACESALAYIEADSCGGLTDAIRAKVLRDLNEAVARADG
jgi:hypothetical protein